MHFDPIEQAAIVAEWDRQARECAVRNRGAFGRYIVLIAVLLTPVVAIEALTHRRSLPVDAIIAMFSAVAMLGLAGALAWAFGSAYASAEAYRRVEKAAEWLAERYAAATPDEKRAAAVTVLANASYRGGPWAIRVYNPRHIAPRLGAALAYIEEVELLLRDERGVARGFTRQSRAAPHHSR